MKLSIKLSQNNLKDIETLLKEYLQIRKPKSVSFKTQETKPIETAKEMLKKIKKIQPDDLVSLKEVGKQIK